MMTIDLFGASALSVGLVVATVGISACGGPSAESVCTTLCDCQKCSDAEYDQCVDGVQNEQEQIETKGCGSERDDYVGCQLDNFECKDGRPDQAEGTCDEEQDALRECLGVIVENDDGEG